MKLARSGGDQVCRVPIPHGRLLVLVACTISAHAELGGGDLLSVAALRRDGIGGGGAALHSRARGRHPLRLPGQLTR
eukprot:2264341-Prymnesium_polylepis.2